MVENDPFYPWFDALERRHLSNLTFAEIRRSVQTLSSLYVERRARFKAASALTGAGKRAAFSLFFAPLHFLLVREIIRALDAFIPAGTTILDLGCGTGSAGAAWALETEPSAKVIGVDTNLWVLEECRWNYRQLGLRGITKKADMNLMRVPSSVAIVAAFAINELEPTAASRLRDQFIRLHRAGAPILVIEPIARQIVNGWDAWTKAVTEGGGREDEWRFRVPLPERLALMDRAAGLDHRELTGRSLWMPTLSDTLTT